jgi:uncharacterized repeat protein (TIGR01451 family)
VKKTQKKLFRVLSFISGTLLVVQSFLPGFIAIRKLNADEEPTPATEQTQGQSQSAPETAQASVSAPTEEPKPTDAPTTPQTDEVVSNPTPTEEPSPIPTTTDSGLTPTLTETPAPTSDPSATPAPVQEQPAADNPTPSGETGPPSTSPAPEASPTPQLSSVPTPTLQPVPVEQECLSDITKDTIAFDWDIDSTREMAQTREKVTLGTKYIYPYDSGVTVTFTCLPKDETLRSTLKIERVKVSDLKLPDSINPATEYAYDITTGMTDGTFAYDVTLPKPNGQTATVSYIEKSADEVKNQTEPLKTEDLKAVEEEKISQEAETVKANGIDHFSIYIVTSPAGDAPKLSTALVNGQTQVTVTPYASITVTMKVTTDGGSNWKSSRYKIGTGSWTCIDTADHNGNGTYTESFIISAPSSTGTYNLSLRAYTSSNCGGTASSDYMMSSAITVQTAAVVTNPTLSQACGLDIALVLDNSTSIDSSELTQMKNAMTSFTNALSGTPTQFSVTHFATTATINQVFTSNITNVNSAINGIPVGGGYTNWEDGFVKARSTLPNRSNPDLIIFASDGNPNTIGNGPENNATEAQAVGAAQFIANAIKTGGTRILGIGIGTDLNSANMQAITGPHVNTGNVLTSDLITTNFSDLATQLANFAKQTCGGTISVNKYIDTISDPTRGGAGWTYSVSGPSPKSLTTSTSGQANTGTITAGTYSVTETNMLSGYSYGSASCKNQAGAPVGTIDNPNKRVTGITISNSDIISCDFVNSANYTPTRICHATGQPDHWVSNTPATLGVLQGHVGAGHQNGNDIIPPIAVFLPSGQNWDTAGQAIWNNDCNIPPATGTLRVIKNVVDPVDPPYPANSWSIHVKQGGNEVTGSPQPGDSNGTVYTLPAGSYQIEEPAITPAPQNMYKTPIFSGDCVSQGGTSRIANVSVVIGQQKTCTITNTRKTGTTKIDKKVDTNGDGVFEGDNTVANNLGFRWSLNGGTADKLMGTTATYGHIGGQGFTINENNVAGYHFVGLYDPARTEYSCSNPFYTILPFGVPPSESLQSFVLCNARDTGTITLDKVTNPSGSSQEFTFHVVQIDNSSWNGATQHFNPLPGGFSQTINVTDLTTPPVITVPTGDYDLYEDTPGGWIQSNYICNYTTGVRSGGGIMNYNFDIRTGENATCTFTNTLQYGSIAGRKVHDINGNGNLLEPEEPLLNGWTIFIDENGNGQLDAGEHSTVTDTIGGNIGEYIFESVLPGTYSVCEVEQTGWKRTVPADSNCRSVTVPAGPIQGEPYWNGHVDFGNIKYAKIIVDKVTEPSEDETPFSFELKDATGSGVSTFSLKDQDHPKEILNLLPGLYNLTEATVSGWIQDAGVCTKNDQTSPTYNPAELNVEAGDVILCTFTNSIRPELQISKENDATGDKAPGDSVGYTITVKALNNAVHNVIVTDLLPAGFVYRPGSGKVDGNPAVFDHEYASPGTWNIGDMNEGQEVKLTLLADISTTQKPGTYRDIALSNGCVGEQGDCSIGGTDSVLAQAVNPGYVKETFVGTDVTVVTPSNPPGVTVNATREETQDRTETINVLGTSTALPSTGADTKWLYMAVILLTGGVGMVIVGHRLLRRYHA